MESGNKEQVALIQNHITIRDILESSEPSFMQIKKKIPLEQLIKPVAIICNNWIEQSGLKGDNVAAPFAAQIIEREPTWTLLDALKFFEFVSFNQHDARLQVMGNVITTLRLMAMVPVYEEAKSEIRERIAKEQKDKVVTEAQDVSAALLDSGKLDPKYLKKDPLDNPVSIKMGKEFEKMMTKNQDKPAYEVGNPNKDWFEKTFGKRERDDNAEYDRVVDINDRKRDESIADYSNFKDENENR